MGFILAITPDGQTLATGSKDKTIKLWNLRTGELIRTLRDSTEVFGVAVSLDGQTLASGGQGKVVQFWDLQTGNCCEPSGIPNQPGLLPLAPMKKTLATGRRCCH